MATLAGMRAFWVTVAAMLCASTSSAQDVFPYEFTIDDLDSGLRLVTVPTPHPGIVSLYIVVSVGSRDEVEQGKSGFAHFFEHMMFRGSKRFTSEEQAALFKRAGAERNAYTTDDYTCFHTTFARSSLETVIEVEADRFKSLEYAEDAFRTEASAVLGEYNTSAANPLVKLLEVVRDVSFKDHTYKHTTMGLLDDIKGMPERYEYSLEFFRSYYRPENVTLIAVGDLERNSTLGLVKKYWGDWKPDDMAVVPVPQPELRQLGPLTCHVPWSSPTQPWVLVSFKGPAFSVTEKDMAVLDVIGALTFSESSEIYQKLYVRGSVVDAFFHQFADHRDPFLLQVLARIKDPEDLPAVRRAILAAFASVAVDPVDVERLARVKSHLRYQFALALDSPGAVGGALAGYVARTRTPAAVNQVYRLYDAVTPEDIRAVAAKYFVESGRLIATLAHGELRSGTERLLSGEPAEESPIPTMLLPSRSPLVSFRVLFRTGSAADPRGAEGLTYLTARLMARGATRSRSYVEVAEALFPMAASIDFSVDKEMTVFSGTVHRDNLGGFYALLRETLLQPAFLERDLARVKSNTLSQLAELRRSNDEELGKEVLYGRVYDGHPYGHHNAGRTAAIEKVTVDDIKRCYAANFTVDNVTIGLAGGYPDLFPHKVVNDLLDSLPTSSGSAIGEIPVPTRIRRSRLTIVEKETRATSLHIGWPIQVNRSHTDWAALWLVRSYLGEHRSENSYLYQRLRELRGLNYGDYAYIEYFPNGSRQFQPDPNLARRWQMFQMWLRPVEPANGPFALKAALHEVRRLMRDGMTKAEFGATREYLVKYSNLLVQSQDRRLGYAMDGGWYGVEADFAEFVKTKLAWLTLSDVNRAIRRHLRTDRLQFVVVTADGRGFADALLGSAPTPPHYGGRVMPPEVAAEDEAIAALAVGVGADDVTIVPVEQVFQ